MYRHIKEYELRFTDVDAYDNLKLSALLAFLEESACLSADELGFGYEAVSAKNLGFVVVNWYLQLNRPVKLGEKLSVHTWPLKAKYLIFFRDYELYCGNELVGVATSRWCMVNVETFATMPVSAFFPEGFFDGYNTERSVEFNSWKIPAVDGGKLVYEKKITFSDYDHYFHLNNTKYADILLDSFAVDDFKGKYLKTAQLTYVKQCKENEVLKCYKQSVDDGWLIEGRVDGEQRVQCKVKLGEI